MKKTLKNTKKFAFIAIFLMITTSSIYTNLISNGIIGDSLLSTPSTSSITHETTNVGYKYNISTWWNTTYKYRIGLEVENTEGFDRYQPVDVYLSFRPEEFYEGTGRLVSCNSTGNNYAGDVLWSDPLPVQVWNESKYSGTDYIHNCTITFIVNVSANSNITYFLYYNNNDDGIVTNKNYNTGFASNLWLDKLTVTVSNTEKYQVVLEKGYGVSDLIKDAVNLHSDDSLAPEKQLDHPDLKFLAHYDGSNVDITGNNPVVTLRGNEYYTDGVIQQAADFDGGSNWDYENGLEGAGDPFSDFSTEFTLTCWINPDSISSGATNHQTENVIAAKASDPYNDNFEIGVNVEGNIHIYLDTETRDTYADFGPAGAITAAGGWYFIACRYRDGVIDVRIDDTWYSNTATWSGATDIDSAAGSPFTIGASDHIDIYFNGQIDEVAVYNSYLSNADIENYKYCSSPSTINSITEIENGQVFSRYQVEWTTAFDMHATDICTFYYDYNLWNINRTIYFDNQFNGSDALAQMTALNTYFNFTGLSSNNQFYYFYDGQSETGGLNNDGQVVENYTVVHDWIHPPKYTIGLFLASYRKIGAAASISYLNGSISYADEVVQFTSGRLNDFQNNIGGSGYLLEVDYWEFIDNTNVTEAYTNAQMIEYFDNVYTSLKSPLKIYIYEQDALFFNLEVEVRDHDGRLVPYVTVHLLNQSTGVEMINQTTDLTGRTKFYRLYNGTYTLNLTYERYSPNILYSIVDNLDVDLTEATTNSFGERTISIENVNLTSITVNLWRYASDIFQEKVEGANATFQVGSTVIGYEDTDSKGSATFHWTNSSGPMGPNVTISFERHDQIIYGINSTWDNDTNDADEFVRFNFYEYQNHTINYDSSDSYGTRLYVDDSGTGDVQLGESFSVWVNFSSVKNGIDDGPIISGQVTYDIKIGTTKINTGTLSFGEIGNGNYSVTINTANPIEPSGAEWLSSTSYTMEIRAYKPGYGTNQTTITFTLNDKDSTLTVLNATPISTYWLSTFSLEVRYQGTVGPVDLSGATVNYYVIAVPGLSGSLIPRGNGRYSLTLNTTLFPEASGREYSIQIVASIQNYASQQVFPSVRIYDILTKINGTDSYDIYTADTELFVGVSQTFYFNYSVALTGSGITSATIKRTSTITHEETGDKFDKDLVHVANGIWSLDIDSETLGIGNYSIKVRIQERNYEEGIAVLSLRVKPRVFSTTALNIYSVVSGTALPIRISIKDSFTGNPITDIPTSDVYIIFEGQIWPLIYQTSGEYAGLYITEIQNIPGGVFLAPLTLFLTLHIERDNFTTIDELITVSVGMIELIPGSGIPLSYFIILIAAAVAVVGALGTYRFVQLRRIPTFVKKNKAMQKSISGKGKISDSLIYPSKEREMVKLLGDKWEAIGLSLADILGLPEKKRKIMPDMKVKDSDKDGGEI